ncbi:hypothetical protein ACFQX6_06120 [Streptosporangium lutulentum]
MADPTHFIVDLPDSLAGGARQAGGFGMTPKLDDGPTTYMTGEEGGEYTTYMTGEEGGDYTTYAIGEEGGW